jgi:antibiotic biosynthesis monooxygenase (ABM) superfamily enzyme
VARRPARQLDRAAAVQGRGGELTSNNRASGSAPTPPEARSGPVTTTVTRRVRPGHEALYEEFLEGIISAARRFPGHLGVEVFRPQSAAGEYRTVYRFDSQEHLRAWLDSDEHAAWLERAEPHVIGPMRTSFVTGLESWFTLPDQPGAAAPPPYKMALLTWITIFPLITAIVALTGPTLKDLPLAVRLGITTALTVPLMTWVVMPRVTRLLHRWLYPGTSR